MNEGSGGLRDRLRRLLAPVQSTILHPQWLASRTRSRRNAWVGSQAAGDVLDVGSADGAVSTLLGQARSYVGLDYPATASGLYATRPDVFGDAARLPFQDGRFDTVLMLDVLEHLAEPGAAAREAARVLRPGGRLLVAVPFAYPMHDLPHDYQRFTGQGLQRLVQAAGLELTSLEEVGGGIAAASLNLNLTLAQSAINALDRPGWRLLALPLAVLLIAPVNLLGWLGSAWLPVPGLLPGTYFLVATRPERHV